MKKLLASLLLFSGLACASITYSTNTGSLGVVEGQTLTFTFPTAVNISLQGQGSFSCTTNCTTSVYTAPASVTGGYMLHGVEVEPPDSIFATRIDSLPVSSLSNTWVSDVHTEETGFAFTFDGGAGAWGDQLVDNTTPVLAPHSFLYGCGPCTVSFPNPSVLTRMHESGAFVNGSYGYDTHETFLNYQTGQIYEQYAVQPSNCCANSGDSWNVNSANPYIPNGGTGYGGIPNILAQLHADDVKYGFTHPLDWSFPEFAPSTGGNQHPWGDYGYIWPACCQAINSGPADVDGATYSTEPPAASLPGIGSWARLSNSWCSANLNSYTGMVYNILAEGCHYGYILDDWSHGGGFGSHIDTDVWQDKNVYNAIKTAEGIISGLWSSSSRTSNIEFLDNSAQMSLSSCAGKSTYTCSQNYQVIPNSYVTPPSYAYATFSDGSDPNVSVNIALIRIGAGTPHPNLTFVAGSYSSGYQINGYVTNSTNQAITWSKDTNYSTGTGTVTAGGLYTPQSSATTVMYDYLIGTAAADTNAKAYVTIKVIPANADGSIRIDAGSATCAYTDSNGKIWIGDQCLGMRAETPSFTTGQTGWPSITPNQAIWESSTQEYAADGDLEYGEFVVPQNTNWDVTLMINKDGSPTHTNGGVSSNTAFGSDGYAGPMPVSANASLGGLVYFGRLPQTNHSYNALWMGGTDYTYTFPATVKGDGILDVRLFAYVNGGHSDPFTAGIVMTPDTTTAPHWAIDNGEMPITSAGKTVQLTLQDWFTGAGSTLTYVPSSSTYAIQTANDFAGDANWSILTQGCSGSSIGSQSGLYTAPSTTPDATCTDIVQITNGSYTATTPITVLGKAGPVSLYQ